MRILHPTDFSGTADTARALAVDIAERLDGPLRFVHVQQSFEAQSGRSYLQPTLDALNPELLRRVHEQREAHVAGLRNRLEGFARETGARASWELLWGEPLRELLAASAAADLVVMGAHGDNPFDAHFMGGLAGRFVRRSSVPVLTVRDEASTRKVRRILVATDFGPASRAAWALCRRLADGSGGDIGLMVAHVIEEERLGDESGYVEAVTQALSDVAGDAAVRHLLREGEPVEVLPRLAVEVGADAIAIGVKRHRGPLGLVLGSRADALLRSSPVPILSVPAPA